MGGLASLIEIPKKYVKGTITKRSRKTVDSRYDLTYGTNDEETLIRDLVKVFDNPNHSAFTRVISLTLRHGARINFLVEQLQKNKNSDMFGFSRCVARMLKNYIEDGTKVTTTCPDCHSQSIVYIEGCETCQGCGYAKCG
jgi:ribonucleoside-diphosphate reductase alpha chain